MSLAILIFSVVMTMGVFKKFTAYLGMTIGLVGVTGGLLGFIPIAVLLAFWFVASGIELYSVGRG